MKKVFELFAAAVMCANLIFASTSTAAATETVIVSNQNHYISYEVGDDENVIFNMESINDFTDEVGGKYPLSDFFSITVDANQNGAIDRGIDFSYGKRNGQVGICTDYLIDQRASTVCGAFKSKAYLDVSFRATKTQAKTHPVYRFTIPKSELKTEASGEVHLVFTCYSGGIGYTNYPAFDRKQFFISLSETIKIEL